MTIHMFLLYTCEVDVIVDYITKYKITTLEERAVHVSKTLLINILSTSPTRGGLLLSVIGSVLFSNKGTIDKGSRNISCCSANHGLERNALDHLRSTE